ncbi:hypothetical protein [Cryptosporangium phraense]|uniref:Uncharacterized protein n=1 Tax=Cryptosporangium phraense TaxID=2593070 RepID=A0A545ATY7_9ACTN|nr:hypothetical protein [Cryptosporangium phraense]TQS44065.1 hypothetical protein FL583_16575 [Cryptosporangium phraense]
MGEFVPAGFDPPSALVTDDFRLEPLDDQHNERDYDAWTSSVDFIHALPGFETWKWPKPMSRAELDRPLYEAVARWLEQSWPFAELVYAPR